MRLRGEYSHLVHDPLLQQLELLPLLPRISAQVGQAEELSQDQVRSFNVGKLQHWAIWAGPKPRLLTDGSATSVEGFGPPGRAESDWADI